MPLLTAALDDAINKITGGNNGNPEALWFFKEDRIGSGAAAGASLGRYHSMWTQNGFPGSSGAAPGTTPRQCTSSTTGAIPFTNASGGRDKYLIGASVQALFQGGVILYDRLADVSGLDGTSGATQTFAAGASLTPSRYTGGKYVQAWIEIYAGIGAGVTATLSYTNELGSAGRTSATVLMGATAQAEQQRLLPVTLQGGDLGIQSVQSLTLSGSTGTVGDFGITLARPLLFIPTLVVGAVTIRDLLDSPVSLAKIEASACLAWAWMPTVVANAGNIFGHLQTVEI